MCQLPPPLGPAVLAQGGVGMGVSLGVLTGALHKEP